MPTGTRSSISTKRAAKPRSATASVPIPGHLFEGLERRPWGHQLRPEDQAVGAHRDENDGRDVAGPGDGEKGPRRQVEIEGQHVIGARGADLVEEGPGLHRHYEEEDEGRENVDDPLALLPHIRPHEIDRDVRPAIARRRDAPEDEDAEE